jgi:hypothetical protein
MVPLHYTAVLAGPSLRSVAIPLVSAKRPFLYSVMPSWKRRVHAHASKALCVNFWCISAQ